MVQLSVELLVATSRNHGNTVGNRPVEVSQNPHYNAAVCRVDNRAFPSGSPRCPDQWGLSVLKTVQNSHDTDGNLLADPESLGLVQSGRRRGRGDHHEITHWVGGGGMPPLQSARSETSVMET